MRSGGRRPVTSTTDWLEFAEVKALSEGDVGRRRAYRILGEIYYRLAEAATTPEEKRLAYERAMKHLEEGLARIASNAPLILANLSGDLPVFVQKEADRAWRIPVRRANDVREFRDYVKDILSGGKLPKFARDADDAAYQRAVGNFQRRIANCRTASSRAPSRA